MDATIAKLSPGCFVTVKSTNATPEESVVADNALNSPSFLLFTPPLLSPPADPLESSRHIVGKEFVVIDTPARPNSDDLKELGNGCDLIILPTPPDVLGLEALLETVENLKGSEFRALLTIVPPKPSKEGEIMKAEFADNNIPTFETTIRRSASFQKAALAGVPVAEIKNPLAHAAASDYEKLGKEILGVLNVKI